MKRLLDLDPAGTGSLRYISRLDREVHLLFGSSLPELPRGDEVEEGGKKIFVEFPRTSEFCSVIFFRPHTTLPSGAPRRISVGIRLISHSGRR